MKKNTVNRSKSYWWGFCFQWSHQTVCGFISCRTGSQFRKISMFTIWDLFPFKRLSSKSLESASFSAEPWAAPTIPVRSGSISTSGWVAATMRSWSCSLTVGKYPRQLTLFAYFKDWTFLYWFKVRNCSKMFGTQT